MKKILPALTTLLLPFIAFAQMKTIPEGTLSQGITSVENLLKSVANWLLTIFLVLAVIFVLLAAYKYLFSKGGDGVSDAHKMLIYAAVAVAVAFLAPGIINLAVSLSTTAGSS